MDKSMTKDNDVCTVIVSVIVQTQCSRCAKPVVECSPTLVNEHRKLKETKKPDDDDDET